MEKREELPFSSEAEKSVLGSMLISADAAADAAELLNAEDFYIARHQDIFAAMTRIVAEGAGLDTVTLVDALERAGQLKNAGGVSYITELSLFTPTAANVSHYIRIVEERSIMRRLMAAAGEIHNDARSGAKAVDVMLDDAERAIFNISLKKSSDTLRHIEGTVLESYMHIGELMKNRGSLTGVPTGYSELDSITSGLQKSDLVILAGRPSMGKTAFALCIAQNAAVKAKKTVCIFSLEMPREQLVTRMICANSGVDMQRVRTGDISDGELVDISEALGPLSSAPIYIDDTPSMSVSEIRSKCRRQKTRNGLDIIIIDYLQQMQTSGRSESRVTEISEVTRALKILARELEVPVLLLSQLSRGPEQRAEHRPVMADLRESGAIEQDADLIMMLYRPSVYDGSDDPTTEVILAKHRNGPTGTVKLAWVPRFARFVEFSDREE